MLCAAAFLLAYLPRTAPVRSFARVQLEKLLDGLLQGDVQIDRITRLTLGGVVAEGVTVHDAQGRAVLRGKRVELGLDLAALLRLQLRFTHGLLEDARIHAVPSEGAAITLFDALSPKPPDPDAPPDASGSALDILFEHVHLRRAHLYGSVPGLAHLEALGLQARGEILIVDGELAVRVTQLRCDLARPFEHALTLEHGTFWLKTSPLRMAARVRVAHENERVRLALSYQLPERGDDHLDLLVGMDPITSELLTDLGIAPAQILLSPIRGHARLSGPLTRLALTSTLRTDAGTIVVHGSFPALTAYQLSIESGRLELAKLIAYAPPLSLALRIDVEAEPDGPVKLKLRAPELELFDVGLRQAAAVGVYRDGRLTIESANLRLAGGRFQTSGWVDADANLSLRIRSQLPEVSADPVVRKLGLRGALRTDVRIERQNEQLAIDGSIGIVQFSYAGITAKEMVLEGRASADENFEHARIDLTGASWGTAFLGRKIGDIEFRTRGKSPHFTADFDLIDRRARTASAHLALEITRSGYRVLLHPLEIGVANRDPWRAKADVSLDDHAITFHQVFLANGPQRLDLQGQYSFSKAYRVEASLQSFDLGGLRELSGLDLADLDGTIDGKLSLSGVPGRPRIDAQGSVRNGVFLGMTDLTVLLSLVSLERRFDIDAEVVLPDRSRLALYAGGEPGTQGDWLKQISAGNYQFGLDFERVPFEVARPWLSWVGVEPPKGSISAVVRGAGTLSAPYFDIHSKVDGLELAPWPKLDLELDAEHDGKRALLRLFRVADEKGDIGRLTGFVEARPEELADPLALRSSLGIRPLELSLTWEDRRLDELPVPLRVDLAMPSWGSLRIVQTDRGPAIDLSTRLGWSEATEGLDSCGAFRHPQVELTLHAHDLRTTGKLTAGLDGEQLAMADVEADTPILAWLTGEQPLFLPRTSFTLDAETRATEEVPYLCDHLAGPLQLSVSALDAFADPPELRLEVRSSALQMVANRQQQQRFGKRAAARQAGRPFALTATANVEGRSFNFRAAVDQGKGSLLQLEGSFPRAAVVSGGASPRDEWPLAALSLEARKLELSSLLVALPASVRASGKLDGQAQLQYDFGRDEVDMSGGFSLSEGRLVLGALGQELSDLTARLRLRGDVVEIEELRARDFDGRLEVDGKLTIAGKRELRTELSLNMRDFPIRRESAQVSRLTGGMQLRATSGSDRTRAELAFGELRVNLPNDLGQGLQGLEAHEDIVVRGEDVEQPDGDPYALELRILAQDPPFRVLRRDLSADVSADLTIRYRAPELTLQGGAEIRRGNFELYGKRFDLRASRMSFDGREDIDPLVSLDAVHRTSGVEIGVRVEGRLSAPRISFSHSNPAITEPGEIIAQLLGARSRDVGTENRDATGAAAGILAGATAGLLTQEVREQFGGALPVLSLESNSQTLRSARIRAGVQLDQLIERRLGALRHVVRGAYVEGFVAPGASTDTLSIDSQPQSRGGGLLELRFPKDLVGTIEYRPVQNWRLDLAWEP